MNWLICTVALAVLLVAVLTTIGLFMRRPPRCRLCGRRDGMTRDGSFSQYRTFRCERCNYLTID